MILFYLLISCVFTLSCESLGFIIIIVLPNISRELITEQKSRGLYTTCTCKKYICAKFDVSEIYVKSYLSLADTRKRGRRLFKLNSLCD